MCPPPLSFTVLVLERWSFIFPFRAAATAAAAAATVVVFFVSQACSFTREIVSLSVAVICLSVRFFYTPSLVLPQSRGADKQ